MLAYNSRTSRLAYLIGSILAVGAGLDTWAATPTAKQALALKPIQSNIEYDQPTESEIGQCTIKPSTVDGKTAWIVMNGDGQLLRKFSDTNGDNVVDHWSYCRNGLEVYRDIDADFNGKADQYRWFHTGGTRWGIDKDENGKIESWKQISAYEVAEVAIEAIKQQDTQLYSTLLPDNKELQSLGLGASLAKSAANSVSEAKAGFASYAKQQKLVKNATKFLDFGASRPAAVPAGLDGLKSDLTMYDNVAALVENDGKPTQLYLGAMVQVDDTWRLLGLPQTGDSASTAELFAMSQSNTQPRIGESGDAPTAEMQKLLAELEKLDAQQSGDTKEQIQLTERRVEILGKLAESSPAGAEREQWQRQQADMLSAAVQTFQYFDAIESIQQLAADLKKQKASAELQAHVEFRRLWSEYVKAQFDPKSDYTKVRDNWLESLEKFAGDYPNLPDTAEALLQLGMEQEFAGEDKEAVAWYEKLVKKFPNSDAGKKAAGAIRRLDSIGKPLSLAGNAVRGGMVDLSGYRRKYVLIHYWATWCEPCKEDMKELKVLHDRYARRGFDIIGVNLDSSVAEAKRYLTSNPLPWKQIYDEGGLDGRLANEMGVMTLPLMLLVDDKGQVLNRNIHLSEVEDELKRVVGRAPQVGRR